MDEERQCAECRRKPGIGAWLAGAARQPEREIPVFEKQSSILDERGQRAVRKKRKKSKMVRVVVAWFVVMWLSVWLQANWGRLTAEGEAKPENKSQGNFAEGTLADERVALLTQALPECHSALAGFLTGGAPEIRNQFVADPIATAGKMAVFYKSNPFPQVDAKDLKRVGQELILVGDEWLIGTQWQGAEGVMFDAVFRRDGATWKLDWEHFSRYGDYPWPLFLAGIGPEEAEFRMLARKVDRRGETENVGSRVRFAFLSPVFGKPAETGMESPVFVVDGRSDEALLLEAAYNAKEAGRNPFGGTLAALEPGDLVRVRIRIKRGEFGGVRSFTLEKVVACHWIGSDEVGFDLDGLKGALLNPD